ncbi:hypothetical protein ER308_04405 [Egibacter rhizosphaerae]|uniref:Ava_C0101 and related proteins n=1 Tax=Egibacter rhizosphaerae TaxID=1670831 RepID=A0A411YCE1_9ACTN|nr:DUF5996 family protein [Egibacter rhizosphaerae]QBI18858.1 hypothetical protein ER308_04405 [Egibacter rhizosphaerae]
MPAPVWPALPLEEWHAPKETLHRYAQIVGKVRLDLVPFQNHWWHVTLHVATRGFSTGPMPSGDKTVEITFDFVDHRLVVTVDDGTVEWFDLVDGLACADFYHQLLATLDRVGVHPQVHPEPFDLDSPAFPNDRQHHAYDPEWVARYWQVLQRIQWVFVEFAGRFNGKQAPVQLFWHSFDLAFQRFSGRPAPPRAGADPVTAEAYSHEVISFGFWPGDTHTPYPAFYSYTAPEPRGLTEQPLAPDTAVWQPTGGSALLPYDDVRTASEPRAALLAFLDSAYQAGATTAGWDLDALATQADPDRKNH